MTLDPVKISEKSALTAADSAAGDRFPVIDVSAGQLKTMTRAELQTAVGGGTAVTADRALVSNGSGAVAASAVTATELGRLSGVTSAVQTQLDAKAASTHSHAISDVTALQTALDAKAAASHSHAISDVTNLQTTLDGKQASSANLSALAGLTGAADRVPYFTALATLALAVLTSFGRSLIAAADAAGVRSLLGLGTAAQSNTGDFAAASHTHAAAEISDSTSAGRAVLTAADAAAQRTALGLGAADVVTFEKLIARQDGGVAGTDDVEVYHDGNNGYIDANSGALRIAGGAPYFVVEMLRTLQMFSGDEFTGNPTLIADALNGQFKFNNAFRVSWSQSASGSDVRDIGLARKSSGLLQVTAGDSGVADIESRQFISTQTTGTAPLTVASTTVVTNLNADKLDGLDAADLVAKSLVTTKGDIIAASGSATPARLPIGTNGQVLTANSAATLGVEWAAAGGSGFGTLATTALITAAGNDTTGTVGDMSKPYTTIQAAYDDGARRFIVEAGKSCGSLSSPTNSVISIVALGGGVTLAAVTTSGANLSIYGNGRDLIEIQGQISANGSGNNAGGALYLHGVTVYTVTANGGNGGAGQAGGNGGTVILRDADLRAGVTANGGNGGNSNGLPADGGQGGAGGLIAIYSSRLPQSEDITISASGGIGGNGYISDGSANGTNGGGGGNGGDVQIHDADDYHDADETIRAGTSLNGAAINVYGNNGGDGGDGDGTYSSGTGGAAGAGGVVGVRGAFLREINANGGNGGTHGADNGGGQGGDGNGGSGGNVFVHRAGVQNLSAAGGAAIGVASHGVGGAIKLRASVVGASISTPDGGGSASGTVEAHFSTLPDCPLVGVASGFFVVENNTPQTTWS